MLQCIQQLHVRSKKIHLPAQKFCDKWAAHAKPHPAEFTTQVGNLLVLRTPVEPCTPHFHCHQTLSHAAALNRLMTSAACTVSRSATKPPRTHIGLCDITAACHGRPRVQPEWPRDCRNTSSVLEKLFVVRKVLLPLLARLSSS